MLFLVEQAVVWGPLLDDLKAIGDKKLGNEILWRKLWVAWLMALMARTWLTYHHINMTHHHHELIMCQAIRTISNCNNIRPFYKTIMLRVSQKQYQAANCSSRILGTFFWDTWYRYGTKSIKYLGPHIPFVFQINIWKVFDNNQSLFKFKLKQKNVTLIGFVKSLD